MKLVQYDIEKVYKREYSKHKNLKLLEEFMDSDMTCAKVVEYTNVSARSCATSLNHSIKRYGFGSIKAIYRNDDVFLVKK